MSLFYSEKLIYYIVPSSLRTQIIKKYENGRAKGILNAGKIYDNKHLQDIQKGIESGNLSIISEKKKFKEKLKKEIGLRDGEFPLIFFPNRLYDQKNPKLLVENAQGLVDKYRVQIAIIANGSQNYEKIFGNIACYSEGMITYHNFDQKLQALAEIGADFCLMTSDYEPCGMPNVTLPKAGTLMIAHNIGGIKDSVRLLDMELGIGNGFLYNVNDKKGLYWAVSKAVDFYNAPVEERQKNLERIIVEHNARHSIKKMAEEYKAILFDLYSGWT